MQHEGDDVRHSIINGNVVMEERVLKGIDQAKVLADARQSASIIAS